MRCHVSLALPAGQQACDGEKRAEAATIRAKTCTTVHAAVHNSWPWHRIKLAPCDRSRSTLPSTGSAGNKSSADSRTSTRSPPDGPAPRREEAGHRHDRVFEPNRLGSGHRLLPIHVMAGDQGSRCLRALQDDAAQWLWLHTSDRPVQDSACARLTSDPQEATAPPWRRGSPLRNCSARSRGQASRSRSQTTIHDSTGVDCR
jgi:hypothetical protein